MRSKIGHLLHKSGHFDSDMHTTVHVSKCMCLWSILTLLSKTSNFQVAYVDSKHATTYALELLSTMIPQGVSKMQAFKVFAAPKSGKS